MNVSLTQTVLLALVALPSALACGCSTSEHPSSRPLQLLISGDTALWLVPCGCTSNQSGGLPRRGTLVAETQRAADVVVADVGGAAAGDTPYDLLKFSALLRGEVAMGLAAHNLGAAEAALGPDRLRGFARDTGVTLISTNVLDRDGTPVVEPWRIVDAADRRVLLLGVLAPRLAPSSLRVTEPRAAILATLAQLQGRFDAAVVLAYLPEDELVQLAGQLPEVDAVIGGPTGQSVPPRRLGPTLLASATNKGKFMVRLTASDSTGATDEHWNGEIVELNEKFADDAKQLANVRRFREELASRDFAATETSFAADRPAGAPDDYRVAGTQSCRECHAADAEGWDKSPHAHAWKSLAADHAQADSACQQCHTTGFGLPGGFVSLCRSADRREVGCESCHGPAAAHADNPRTHTAWFAQARDQCERCHDRENSPRFNFDTYWPRIAHGAQPPLAAAREEKSP